MNMQRNSGRVKNRHKQTKQEKFTALNQTVKAVQESLANGNGNHTDTPTAEAPAEKSGLVESLRAENVILHRKHDALTADMMQSAQRIAELEAELAALKTATVECSIQYDVKAPDLARWRNAGWQVKHYEFVDNERSLPVLAVVMERPVVAATDLAMQEEANIQPGAPAPLNFAATQPVEIDFNDILIADEPEPANEPEFVPSMDATGITIEPAENTRADNLLKKLAADKPIFSAILEHGVDAVIDAMDAQVMDVARAAYEAATAEMPKPWRFESKLLSSGSDNLTGNANPGEITIEEELKEVVLS